MCEAKTGSPQDEGLQKRRRKPEGGDAPVAAGPDVSEAALDRGLIEELIERHREALDRLAKR